MVADHHREFFPRLVPFCPTFLFLIFAYFSRNEVDGKPRKMRSEVSSYGGKPKTLSRGGTDLSPGAKTDSNDIGMT